MEKKGLTYVHLQYGHYEQQRFRTLLDRARGMLFLSESETQGLAYQQAMACNVPVLAWDNGFWLNTIRLRYQNEFVSASSVPYISRGMRRAVPDCKCVPWDAEYVLRRQDFLRLGEFDALFIRETTALTNHTYRFARKAEREGMAVIDDPSSIVRCTNKVYLAELMAAHGIPTPRTMILDRRHLKAIGSQLGFPIVLKVPDGSFSRGVYKVE